jgi:hypothetical protein
MDLTKAAARLDWSGARQRLWLAWQASDPDWLRLTQSLKTVLAVVVTLGIVYPLAPGNVFLSAIGAGFLMQCGEGTTRLRQQLTLLLCGLALMLLASLGAAASSHRELREALIIVVAFLTFYLRRFVTRRPGFTAYAFVVCLLATVLPGGREQAVRHIEVLGVALTVAFVVFFYLRPPNYRNAFAAGTRVFCACVGSLLRVLDVESDPQESTSYQHLVKRALRFNQALADGLQDGPDSQAIDELLVGQYDVWQSMEMLEDSLGHLQKSNLERLPGIAKAMRVGLDNLACAFDRRGAGPDEQGQPASARCLSALEIELLRSKSHPDRSWVYLGGILLAGRRLETQAERMAERVRKPPREQAS